MYLAQFNIGKLRYPLDDPRMSEFVDNVDLINGLADKIDGFVWRLHDETGTALHIRVYDDPMIVPNLTIWQDEASLRRFAHHTLHQRFFMRASEWFLPVDGPKAVMWWIPENHRPEMMEGVERLQHLKDHGSTEFAFTWTTKHL